MGEKLMEVDQTKTELLIEVVVVNLGKHPAVDGEPAEAVEVMEIAAEDRHWTLFVSTLG